jgi:CRP-like cAMP-binding protein
LGNGEYLYRPATPVRALYAVQTSMAKTVTVDVVGREKVLAFHLPGEVIGLDAACQGQYDNSVVAWQEPVLQVSVRRHPPTRQSPDQRAMAFDAFTEPSTSAIPALRLRPSG